MWLFGSSENIVISNEIYAWGEPLRHTLSSLSRLVIKMFPTGEKKKKSYELKSWALCQGTNDYCIKM